MIFSRGARAAGDPRRRRGRRRSRGRSRSTRGNRATTSSSENAAARATRSATTAWTGTSAGRDSGSARARSISTREAAWTTTRRRGARARSPSRFSTTGRGTGEGASFLALLFAIPRRALFPPGRRRLDARSRVESARRDAGDALRRVVASFPRAASRPRARVEATARGNPARFAPFLFLRGGTGQSRARNSQK